MTDQPLPRTADEILERMRALATTTGADQFGIERSRLLDALPFDLAKEWFHDGKEPEPAAWESKRIKTRQYALILIETWLTRAWDDANQRRYLSVAKAVAHFRGLFWLIGNDAMVTTLAPGEMVFWGKPQLVAVSQAIGVDWKALDDDRWYEPPDNEGKLPEPMTAFEAMEGL